MLTHSLELAGASDAIELEQMDILRDFTREEILILQQKLTRNIALEMSERLRIRTNEIRILEES